MFVYIILIFLFLEITLQTASLFLRFRIKENLVKGGDFNILCVGDSFTYGLGAPKDESYPRQLEKILSTYHQGRIKVVNLGVPGYNSSQCLLKLRDSIGVYKPKAIIAMMGMNNCWNFMDSNYFKIAQGTYNYPLTLQMRYMDSLLSKSKIYKLFKIAFLNIQHGRFSKKQLAQAGASYHNHIFPVRSSEVIDLLKQGGICYEAGNYSAAEPYYQKAMELSPDDFEPHWYMGRLYRFRGETDESQKNLLLALKLAPTPEIAVAILTEMDDKSKSIKSQSFKQFSDTVKDLRKEWIERFGKETVMRIIDPMVSSEEEVRTKAFFYDCVEMKKLADKQKSIFFLMTYPGFSPEKFRMPQDIYLIIAAYLDIPLINNTEIFNQHLRFYKRNELFVSDGHCASKGNRMVAENASNMLKEYNLL